MGIELAKAFIRVRGDSSALTGDLSRVQSNVSRFVTMTSEQAQIAFRGRLDTLQTDLTRVDALTRSSLASTSAKSVVEIRGRLGELQSRLAEAEQQVAAGGQRMSSNAVVKFDADIAALQQQLSEAESAVQKHLKGIQIQAAAVMATVGAVGGRILKQGFGQAAELEQTTIAFETMLGSIEETRTTLSDLTEFAAKTPFQMPGILQAARGLIQFGERGDDLMETLNILGNAASGTGTEFGMLALIFNQVRGVGNLLTQDFRQLSTRGVISLQDIADYFGVTTAAAQEMMSAGQVSFEDLRSILKKLSEDGGRFFNLMERQSRSMIGLTSTLSDAWNILARTLAESLLPAAKLVTGGLISTVEVLRSFVSEGGTVVSRAFQMGTAVGTLAAAFKGLSIAARFAGITLKSFLIGTGIGAAIVAVGMAVGALVGGLESLWPEAARTEQKLRDTGSAAANAEQQLHGAAKAAGTFAAIQSDELNPSLLSAINMLPAYIQRIRDLQSLLDTGLAIVPAVMEREADDFLRQFTQTFEAFQQSVQNGVRPVDQLRNVLADLNAAADILSDNDLFRPVMFENFKQAITDEIGRLSGFTDQIGDLRNQLALLTGEKTDIDIAVEKLIARGALQEQADELRSVLQEIAAVRSQREASDAAAKEQERQQRERQQEIDQERRSREEAAKSLAKKFQNPMDALREQLREFRSLRDEGLISEETFRAAAADAFEAADKSVADLAKKRQDMFLAGVHSFEGIGKAAQQALLKPDSEEKKQTDFLKMGLDKQDQLIAAVLGLQTTAQVNGTAPQGGFFGPPPDAELNPFLNGAMSSGDLAAAQKATGQALDASLDSERNNLLREMIKRQDETIKATREPRALGLA